MALYPAVDAMPTSSSDDRPFFLILPPRHCIGYSTGRHRSTSGACVAQYQGRTPRMPGRLTDERQKTKRKKAKERHAGPKRRAQFGGGQGRGCGKVIVTRSKKKTSTEAEGRARPRSESRQRPVQKAMAGRAARRRRSTAETRWKERERGHESASLAYIAFQPVGTARCSAARDAARRTRLGWRGKSQAAAEPAHRGPCVFVCCAPAALRRARPPKTKGESAADPMETANERRRRRRTPFGRKANAAVRIPLKGPRSSVVLRWPRTTSVAGTAAGEGDRARFRHLGPVDRRAVGARDPQSFRRRLSGLPRHRRCPFVATKNFVPRRITWGRMVLVAERRSHRDLSVFPVHRRSRRSSSSSLGTTDTRRRTGVVWRHRAQAGSTVCERWLLQPDLVPPFGCRERHRAWCRGLNA